MSYQNGLYNGAFFIGTVKWSNDYKHVMDFGNVANRNKFLMENLKRVNGFIGLIPSPNGYFDYEGILENVENKNYFFYANSSDISRTYYCCFITNYEILAQGTTRLYLELDVFQQYFYNTTFYKSDIERAIVSKNSDVAGDYTLPEPVNAQVDVQHLKKNIFEQGKWEPKWILHTASIYNNSDKKYHYTGNGSSNTFGEYGCLIDSLSDMQDKIKQYGRKSVEEIAEDVGSSSGNTTWKDWVNAIFSGSALQDTIDSVRATTSIADLQDHRQELIGLYAVPKWLIDAYPDDTSNLTNQNIEVTESIPLNASTLANGYTPRNKKLLTSICRVYVLANRTGLKIPFKPELFVDGNGNFVNSTSLTLRGIAMSTQGYQYRLSNYKDEQTAYGEVAYNTERRVGYDANTGINKAIALTSASSQILSGGSQIATGNPLAIINGASSIMSGGLNAIDQVGTKEAHFGSNGDLLRTKGLYSQLHFYEVSPPLDQCIAIDNFFDMYGYQLNRHLNPSGFLRNRSLWNFIKTNNINLRVSAPSDYENKIKEIFNNGVTIWHNSYENNTGYNYFGDYERTNN